MGQAFCTHPCERSYSCYPFLNFVSYLYEGTRDKVFLHLHFSIEDGSILSNAELIHQGDVTSIELMVVF